MPVPPTNKQRERTRVSYLTLGCQRTEDYSYIPKRSVHKVTAVISPNRIKMLYARLNATHPLLTVTSITQRPMQSKSTFAFLKIIKKIYLTMYACRTHSFCLFFFLKNLHFHEGKNCVSLFYFCIF
jgi:hypothetical protein